MPDLFMIAWVRFDSAIFDAAPQRAYALAEDATMAIAAAMARGLVDPTDLVWTTPAPDDWRQTLSPDVLETLEAERVIVPVA